MKTPPPYRIFSTLFLVLAFYFLMYPSRFLEIKLWMKQCSVTDILWFIVGLLAGILTVFLSNRFEQETKS